MKLPFELSLTYLTPPPHTHTHPPCIHSQYEWAQAFLIFRCTSVYCCERKQRGRPENYIGYCKGTEICCTKKTGANWRTVIRPKFSPWKFRLQGAHGKFDLETKKFNCNHAVLVLDCEPSGPKFLSYTFKMHYLKNWKEGLPLHPSEGRIKDIVPRECYLLDLIGSWVKRVFQLHQI